MYSTLFRVLYSNDIIIIIITKSATSGPGGQLAAAITDPGGPIMGGLVVA